MLGRNKGKLLLLLLLAVLFAVLLTGNLLQQGAVNRKQKENIDNPQYRSSFFSNEMRAKKNELSNSCRSFLDHVEKEVRYFPIPVSTVDKSLSVSYVNAWMAERKYKGTSGHEGTDIMAAKNERGIYPVVSMTDGTITNLGWLEKGGYRIGITTNSGTYYYYAHLDSYANIKEGAQVKAGELLGYMGDSGYGEEGTTGKFDVHLHLGIYSYETGEEISMNPYYVLDFLENKKLKYRYS